MATVEPEEQVNIGNNSRIRDRAIGDFNRLKEAYTLLYQQNQRLISENERWKTAIAEFGDVVKKNMDEMGNKIIEKIEGIDLGDGDGDDDNDGNGRTGSRRRIDYDEIKNRCKQACTEALEEVQDFLPNLSSDVGGLLDQMPPPSETLITPLPETDS